MWLILPGIVKKVIIADYIAQYNNWIFDTPTDYTGFECLMGVIGFSVQIFCDFSGYSDLAIGLAALMGFRLQDNFRFPYQATSLTEFLAPLAHLSLPPGFATTSISRWGATAVESCAPTSTTLPPCSSQAYGMGPRACSSSGGLLHGVGLVVNKFFHRHVFVQIPPSPFAKPLALADNVWLCGVRVDLLPCALTHHGAPAAPPDLLRLLPDGVPPLPRRAPLWTVLTLGAMELHSVRERDYLWLRDRFVALPCCWKLLVALVVVQAAINLSGSLRCNRLSIAASDVPQHK